MTYFQNRRIAETIYLQNWEDKSLVVKKMILLIGIRSRKLAGVTVGKIYFINRPLCTAFINASIAYFMFLKTVYQNHRGH